MPSGASRRTTLADIAARAGTTVSTVSKVLNGRADVSAETRERVLALASETGYRKRGGDPARFGAGSPFIDLVLSGVEGSWANQVLSGVEHIASAAGLDVVVTVARDDRDGPGRDSPGHGGREQRDWVTRLLSRGSGGAVIALITPTPAQRSALQSAGIHAVLLDPTSDPPARTPSIGASNWAGGRAAAEHLLKLGHTRIGVIGGKAEHRYSQARLDGFLSALREAGIDQPGALISFADWHRAAAARAAASMLDGIPSAGLAAGEPRTPAPGSANIRPTAIFACSDTMALGVFEAAAERGLRVPDDLSIVGFDDLPEARWTTPPLTTIRQPITEMGAAAVRLLIRLRSGEVPEALREELATSLILRSSTGAVP